VNRGLIGQFWYTESRMPVGVSGQQDQTPDLVRAHLERVLDSPQFHNSWRRARFLRAVVERSLEGRAEDLKESVVGVMVFDRPPDYDPKIDSIVRVQARQLRGKLREYYAGPGSGERIRIELPKGSYAPVIRTMGQAETTRLVAIDSVTPRAAAHLAVLPFESLGPDSDNEYFSEGITDEILTALSRVPGLRLIARSSVFQFKGQTGDVRRIARQLNAECVLEGSVRRSGDQVRIAAQLIQGADGTHLWGETFDACIADPRQVFAIQEAIALEIISHFANLRSRGCIVGAGNFPRPDFECGGLSGLPAGSQTDARIAHARRGKSHPDVGGRDCQG
jgi:adenylate cyclase